MYFRKLIEHFYIKYNSNSTVYKRDLKDLSYFEKLFLVLFNRKNAFGNSVGNLYSNSNFFDYRRDNYPLVFFFHLYYEKVKFKFSNLKNLSKQFYFFNKSIIFKTITKHLQFYFFKKNKNKKFSDFMVFLIIQKILYKRYYDLCNSIFFEKLNYNNLVKFNWMFYIFLLRSNKKLIIYDLSKYSD